MAVAHRRNRHRLIVSILFSASFVTLVSGEDLLANVDLLETDLDEPVDEKEKVVVKVTKGNNNTFGPGGCVTVSRNQEAGTCVIKTQCGSVDLSDVEFAFICFNPGSSLPHALHSFGRGDFDQVETFNTGVKCKKCASLGKASEDGPPALRAAIRAQQKAPATDNGYVEEPKTASRFGPKACVSTWKSPGGTCMIRTACQETEELQEALKDFNVGVTCLDPTGDYTRYLFGKEAFKAEETFDTRFQCSSCLGVATDPAWRNLNGIMPKRLIEDVNRLALQVGQLAGKMEAIEAVVPSMRKEKNQTIVVSKKDTIPPKEESLKNNGAVEEEGENEKKEGENEKKEEEGENEKKEEGEEEKKEEGEEEQNEEEREDKFAATGPLAPAPSHAGAPTPAPAAKKAPAELQNLASAPRERQAKSESKAAAEAAPKEQAKLAQKDVAKSSPKGRATTAPQEAALQHSKIMPKEEPIHVPKKPTKVAKASAERNNDDSDIQDSEASKGTEVSPPIQDTSEESSVKRVLEEREQALSEVAALRQQLLSQRAASAEETATSEADDAAANNDDTDIDPPDPDDLDAAGPEDLPTDAEADAGAGPTVRLAEDETTSDIEEGKPEQKSSRDGDEASPSMFIARGSDAGSTSLFSSGSTNPVSADKLMAAATRIASAADLAAMAVDQEAKEEEVIFHHRQHAPAKNVPYSLKDMFRQLAR